jgi:hypothetical protein
LFVALGFVEMLSSVLDVTLQLGGTGLAEAIVYTPELVDPEPHVDIVECEDPSGKKLRSLKRYE